MSKILHVYGSDGPHGNVFIAGTQESLTYLRDMINIALNPKWKLASATSETSDGEAYCVMIYMLDDERAKRLTSHYTDTEMFPEQRADALSPVEAMYGRDEGEGRGDE